jgi:hypothetical protein
MDYQVLEVGYVFVDLRVLELQLLELVPCSQFAGRVHELVLECLLKLFPYSGHIVVDRVESPEGVNHVTHP